MAADKFTDKSHSNAANDSAKKIRKLKKEETKLKEQIAELKAIITQAELSLDTVKFGNIELVKNDQLSVSNRSLTKTKILNTTVKLHNELYKYSGFYCSKFSNTEYIFHFPISCDTEEKEFAVQIFNENGKGSLGKWVMPMSINIDEVLAEIPINNLKNIIPFLKKCKYLIDCYTIRLDQFEKLKKSTEQVKNFTIDTNMGYTQINLEFFGFHSTTDDKYINLIVYLFYEADETRPQTMKIDSSGKKGITNAIMAKLKQMLKPFKNLELQEAYEQIQAEQNSSFVWTQADEESLLALNGTSSSEEDYLTIAKEKRTIVKKKRKHLIELQKKWQARKQNVKSSRILRKVDLSDDEDNTQSSESTVLANRRSINELKKKKGISMTISPNKNPPKRLKQAKLNFQSKSNTRTDEKSNLEEPEAESSPASTLSHKNREVRFLTSTPMVPSKNRLRNPSLSNLEVTNIIGGENKLGKVRSREPLRVLRNRSINRSRNYIRN